MYLLLAVVPHAGRQNVSADHRLEKDGGGHGHARHRKPDRPYAPAPGLWAEPYDHGRRDPAVPVSPTYVQCTRGQRDGRRLVQPSRFTVPSEKSGKRVSGSDGVGRHWRSVCEFIEL